MSAWLFINTFLVLSGTIIAAAILVFLVHTGSIAPLTDDPNAIYTAVPIQNILLVSSIASSIIPFLRFTPAIPTIR